MSIMDLIRTRHSTRRYEMEKISPPTLEAVITAARESEELVAGLKVAFHLLDDEGGIGRQLMGVAGRYGQIIRAPHFVVALSENQPGYMENLGFRMEAMILEATRHGLGTCWTGGMWKEASLKKFMNIGSDMRVIALTPLGFEDRSLSGSLFNKALSVSAPNRARRHPFEKIVYKEKSDRKNSDYLDLFRYGMPGLELLGIEGADIPAICVIVLFLPQGLKMLHGDASIKTKIGLPLFLILNESSTLFHGRNDGVAPWRQGTGWAENYPTKGPDGRLRGSRARRPEGFLPGRVFPTSPCIRSSPKDGGGPGSVLIRTAPY